VVSATDPHGRNLGFLDQEQLHFHSSSSSVILTRLSRRRSRTTTSQKEVVGLESLRKITALGFSINNSIGAYPVDLSTEEFNQSSI
jgi:hypothetical protein